jgi:hypothetical protein
MGIMNRCVGVGQDIPYEDFKSWSLRKSGDSSFFSDACQLARDDGGDRFTVLIRAIEASGALNLWQ